MSNTPKKLRCRLEKLIDSGPLKINKIEIITRKVLEELEISKINETKNLEEIEMEALMLVGKMKFEKIRNSLYEFEMNELEAKVNAEVVILKKKESNLRNIMKDIEKLELESLKMMKTKEALMKERREREKKNLSGIDKIIKRNLQDFQREVIKLCN